jgi:hypothetical protein
MSGTGAQVRRVLEATTNVAIVVVVVMFGFAYFAHKTIRFAAPPAGQDAHLKGLVVKEIAGYNWGSQPETLVLAIRKGCHYCEASIPFYKRLADLEKSKGIHAHVLAVMPDSEADGASLLQSNGLMVDAVYKQPLDSFSVSGTPTLLLLDSHGRVEEGWVGQLPSHGEEEVIAAAKQ